MTHRNRAPPVVVSASGSLFDMAQLPIEGLDGAKVGRTLGVGAYATVYEASWQGEPVALKVIHPHFQYRNSPNLALFLKEAHFLTGCNQSAIIGCKGVLRVPPNLPGLQNTAGGGSGSDSRRPDGALWAMVLELGEAGSLAQLLGDVTEGRLQPYSNDQALQWAMDVAGALLFLHTREPGNTLHRDVKLANVVLSQAPKTGDEPARYVAKTIDFGLVVQLETDEVSSRPLYLRKQVGSATTNNTNSSSKPMSPLATMTVQQSALSVLERLESGPIGGHEFSSSDDEEPGDGHGVGSGGGFGSGGVAAAEAPPGDLFMALHSNGMVCSDVACVPITDLIPSVSTADAKHAAFLQRNPLPATHHRQQRRSSGTSVAPLSRLQLASPHQHARTHRTSVSLLRPASSLPEALPDDACRMSTHFRRRSCPFGSVPWEETTSCAQDTQPQRCAAGTSPGGTACAASCHGVTAKRYLAECCGLVTDGAPTTSGRLPADLHDAASTTASPEHPGYGTHGGGTPTTTSGQLTADSHDVATTTTAPQHPGCGRIPSHDGFAAGARQHQPASVSDGHPSLQPASTTSTSHTALHTASQTHHGALDSASEQSAAACIVNGTAEGAAALRQQQQYVPSSGGAVAHVHTLDSLLALKGGSSDSVSSARLPRGAKGLLRDDGGGGGLEDGGAAAAAAVAPSPTSPNDGLSRSDTADGHDPFRGSSAQFELNNEGTARYDAASSSTMGYDTRCKGLVEAAGSPSSAGRAVASGDRSERLMSCASGAGGPGRRRPTSLSQVVLHGGGGVVSGSSGDDLAATPSGGSLASLALRHLRSARTDDSFVRWELCFSLTGKTGSAMYMAPEVFRHYPYSLSSDVFSFGVVLYELLAGALLGSTHLSGRIPALMHVSTPRQYAFEVAAGYRPQRHHNMQRGSECWKLICDCWHSDPCQRPSMEDVLLRLQAVRKHSSEVWLSSSASGAVAPRVWRREACVPPTSLLLGDMKGHAVAEHEPAVPMCGCVIC